MLKEWDDFDREAAGEGAAISKSNGYRLSRSRKPRSIDRRDVPKKKVDLLAALNIVTPRSNDV